MSLPLPHTFGPVDISESEYLFALLRLQLRSFLLGFLPVALIFQLWFWRTISLPADRIRLAFEWCGFSLIAAMALGVWIWWKVRAAYRNHAEAGRRVSWIITEGGWSVGGPEQHVDLAWIDVKKLRFIGGMAVVFASKRRAYFLPRRAFSSAQGEAGLAALVKTWPRTS